MMNFYFLTFQLHNWDLNVSTQGLDLNFMFYFCLSCWLCFHLLSLEAVIFSGYFTPEQRKNPADRFIGIQGTNQKRQLFLSLTEDMLLVLHIQKTKALSAILAGLWQMNNKSSSHYRYMYSFATFFAVNHMCSSLQATNLFCAALESAAHGQPNTYIMEQEFE